MSLIMGLLVGFCAFIMARASSTKWKNDGSIPIGIVCGLFWPITLVLFILACLIHAINPMRKSVIYFRSEGE